MSDLPFVKSPHPSSTPEPVIGQVCLPWPPPAYLFEDFLIALRAHPILWEQLLHLNVKPLDLKQVIHDLPVEVWWAEHKWDVHEFWDQHLLPTAWARYGTSPEAGALKLFRHLLTWLPHPIQAPPPAEVFFAIDPHDQWEQFRLWDKKRPEDVYREHEIPPQFRTTVPVITRDHQTFNHDHTVNIRGQIVPARVRTMTAEQRQQAAERLHIHRLRACTANIRLQTACLRKMEAAKRICEQADKDLMDAMMQEVHDEIAQEEERGREADTLVLGGAIVHYQDRLISE